MSRKPGYRQFVLELSATIGETPQIKHGNSHKLVRAMVSQVMRLVLLLPSLQKFTWDSCDTIPGPLVTLLNVHPTVKEMSIKFAHWGTEDLAIPEELYNNPKLTSLTEVVYGRDDEQDDSSNLAKLRRLVTSSPNLQDLDMNLNTGGGRIGRTTTQSLAFTETETETWMPLKFMSLEHYTFEDEGPSGIQRHIDARCLQQLTLKQCRYNFRLFDRLYHQPLRLKSLELEGFRPTEAMPAGADRAFLASLNRFLLSFMGLEQLALTDSGPVKPHYGIGGILHHALSLQYLKLDITEWRSGVAHYVHYDNDEFDLPIVLESFQEIMEKCTRLEELHIYLTQRYLREVSFFL
jgi:hypothetical protein